MVRWIVIGAVGVVAFTIFALVDLFMTRTPRVRAFPKPLWIAIIVVLPVVGPALWLLVGKAKKKRPSAPSTGKTPDDDASFLSSIDREESDERIRRLEEELRKLDDEAPPDGPDRGSPPQKP